MTLVIIRVHRWCDGRITLCNWQRGVIAQLFIREVEVDRIKAETIYAALEPEPRRI